MKRNIMNQIILKGTLAILLVCQGMQGLEAAERNLSFDDLVERMYSVKHLATPPIPGEKGGCYSSSEKSATYDEKTGLYTNWHSNKDGDGMEAVSGKGDDVEYTLCKIDGPGVVWRIWSAMPKQGDIEIYVDGASEPALKMPFIKFFERFGPESKDGHYPALEHTVAKGRNTFIPIPFQKSIEFRAKKDWGRYYQITYTQFPEDTKVPSFTGSYTEAQHRALKKADEAWAKRGARQFAQGTPLTKKVTLKPNSTTEVLKLDKPGAITSLVLKLPAFSEEESVTALRAMTISMYWDGQKEPSVWAPVGDLFGLAGGKVYYRMLMTGAAKAGDQDEYYANWYMPYRSARIVLGNDAAKAYEVELEVHTEELSQPADELLRFHCKWHRDDFTGFDEERLWNDRWPDWPVLFVDDTKGRFCGFMAHMWNPNHQWNKAHRAKHARPYPTKGVLQDVNSSAFQFFERNVIADKYWWGEGDEKFFVDGEKMPSTYGTGTEDYFGYAWGTSQSFDSAMQAQPRTGKANEIGKMVDGRYVGNIGHIVNVRWQVADSVAFQKSFEATVEKYHPNAWPLHNAYTVVWYQEPGKSSPYDPVLSVEQRSDYYDEAKLMPPPPVIENGRYDAAVMGHLRTWKGMGGYSSAIRQGMEKGKGWTADRQWLIKLQGNKSSHQFEFYVSDALAKKTRSATIGLTKAPDYGVVDILIDGKLFAEGIDCQGDTLAPGLKIEIPELQLTPGNHRLMIRASKEPTKRTRWWAGLDYLQLK